MNIEKNGRYWQVTGLPGHTLLLDNKHDARKHIRYLEEKQRITEKWRSDMMRTTNEAYAIRTLANRIRVHGDAYSSGLANEILDILTEGG